MAIFCRYVPWLIFFLPISAAAAEESALNVFTDLAPLLALFGEQFARQFMSESLTWLDHIVFAMVPLGILTAIVGAIRVSGPGWARAFIGRARETRAAAEIELMSSTSREVCEVFNGKGVVRAMGTPQLTQFILFPPSYRTDESTCGIHTLETAYCSEPSILEKGRFDIHSQWGREESIKGRTVSWGMDSALSVAVGVGMGKRLRMRKETRLPGATHLTKCDQPEPRLSRLYRRLHAKPRDLENGRDAEVSAPPMESDVIQCSVSKAPFPAELKDSAPNLQLNLPMSLHSHKDSITELWYAAVAALSLQLGVLVVSAITTFHARTRSIVGEPEANFWFWIFIAGTVCLNLGMSLCSWVIEQGTKEHVWRKKVTKEKPNCDSEQRELSDEQLSLQNDKSQSKIASVDNLSQLGPHQIKMQIKPTKPLKEDDQSMEDDSTVQLFWLQQKHKVNDQDFEPFLILGGRKSEILTSSRIEHKRWPKSVGRPTWMKRIVANSFELVTILATALGVIGFILQFEGLRGLSYPTAVTQLLAILVMAFIRAFVRRRLGNFLSTIPASAGRELDWLALRLVYRNDSLEAPPRYKEFEETVSLTRWRILTQPDLLRRHRGERYNAAGVKLEARQAEQTENSFNQRLLVKPGELSYLNDGRISLNSSTGDHNTAELTTPSTPIETQTRQLFPPNSQMLLKVRRRLGELTNCPGTASTEAIALSQAMSLILNELCPIPEGKEQVFTWHLEAIVEKAQLKSKRMRGPEVDSIALQVNGNGSGWHVNAPDLDAILSLWMFSFADSNATTPVAKDTQQSDWLTKVASSTVKYRRILGENPFPYTSPEGTETTHIHTNILTRDLNWWTNDARIAAINDDRQPGKTVNDESLKKTSTGDIKLVIGFNGLVLPAVKRDDSDYNKAQMDDSEDDEDDGQGDEDYEFSQDASRRETGKTVPIISSGPLANILAHHLFSAFMWAVSPFIPRDSFTQATIDDSDLFDGTDFEITWNLPTLRNKKMMKLARDIEAFGLGPVEDILLGIIPPLSYRGILPNEVMMRVLLKKIPDYEEYHNWSQVQRVYLNLLQLDLDPRRMDRISYEVVVELIEFLFIVREAVEDLDGSTTEQETNDDKQAVSLKETEKSIMKMLSEHELLFNVARELQMFFRKQGRDKTFDRLFKTLEQDNTQTTPVAKRVTVEPTELTKSARRRQDRRLFRITSFTPFHKYCSKQSFKIEKGAQAPMNMLEVWKQLAKKPDIFGWYPLHYATVGQNNQVFETVLRGSGDNGPLLHELRNKCGRTPLHYAAMQNSNRVKRFLETGEFNFRSAANVQGRGGILPIHCAAKCGKDMSIKNLDGYSNSATLDAFGRSALHIGVSFGNASVVELLLKGNAKEQHIRAMTVCDEGKITPIMLLLRREDGHFLAGLLRHFPRAVWEAEPGISSSAAVKCFHTMLEEAVRLRRRKSLDTMFQHITDQAWEDNWIFEAFSIAYQSDRLDMLLDLLDSVDSLASENILATTAGLRGTEDTHFGLTGSKGELLRPGTAGYDRSRRSRSAKGGKTTEEGKRDTQDANVTADISSKVRNYLKTELNIKESAVLIWAIRNGNIEFVRNLMRKGLIERRADKVPWNEKDSDNRSPLAYIAKVKPSLDPEAGLTLEKREKVLDFLWSSWDDSRKIAALNSRQGSYDKTPLIYAVRNELVHLVEVFVQAGANIRGEDVHERSAFMYAYYKRDDIREKIWRILVEHDPDVVNERSGDWKSTPLIQAARSCHMDIIEYLSQCGRSGPVEGITTDPNIGDKDGDPPLSWCIYENKPASMDAILKLFPNANPHKRNLDGRSPLLIAYQRCQDPDDFPYFPNLLTSRKVNKRGYEVSLLLSHAIYHKHMELVNHLLVAGADPYAADDAGRSHLSIAALHGNLDIFRRVLAEMKDDIKTRTHLELIHYACAQRNDDVSEQIVAELVKADIQPASFDINGWSLQDCKLSVEKDAQTEKTTNFTSSTESVTRWHRRPSTWAINPNNPFFRIVRNAQIELIAPFPAGLSKGDEARVLVRANHCIPFHETDYYWELRIVKKPPDMVRDLTVAIGICTQGVNCNAYPGSRGSASYGYHSDDGQIFHMASTGEGTGHTYGPSDVVGCLLKMENRANRTIKFMYNGKAIGSTVQLADDFRGQLYPCVGFCASAAAVGTVIEADFQAQQPFGGESRNTRAALRAPRLQSFDEREEDALELGERPTSGLDHSKMDLNLSKRRMRVKGKAQNRFKSKKGDRLAGNIANGA